MNTVALNVQRSTLIVVDVVKIKQFDRDSVENPILMGVSGRLPDLTQPCKAFILGISSLIQLFHDGAAAKAMRTNTSSSADTY